jgi:hypothetical protein
VIATRTGDATYADVCSVPTTISFEGSPFVVATGGTVEDVTIDGTTYRQHTFTTPGANTFTVADAGPTGEVEYLLVGGGGAGGVAGPGGSTGAGGSGGMVTTGATTLTGGVYTVTVGAGGAPATLARQISGGRGGSSSFGALAASGGLGGATTGLTWHAFTNTDAVDYPDDEAEMDLVYTSGTYVSSGSTTVGAFSSVDPQQVNALNWDGFTQLRTAIGNVAIDQHRFALMVTGTFVPTESGVYTFNLEGDDAVDLHVGGQLLVHQYGPNGMAALGTHTATVTLEAGQAYSFRVRQYENGGGDGLRVFWRKPSQAGDSAWYQDGTELGAGGGVTLTGTAVTFSGASVVYSADGSLDCQVSGCVAATGNTGNGGAGGSTTAAAGGSGLVVIRYRLVP